MFLRNKISLRQNILSNFATQGWSFLVGMIAVPFYLQFLGVEGYGLVGFYGALRAVFNSFLDFGFTLTINREVARYAASPTKVAQTRDLVRTLELAYWLIGFMLGLLVCLGAPFIANYWLNSETIPTTTVENVLVIMGIFTFIQWPLSFYQGGLIGLEKIVLLNGVNVTVATLRAAGGVLAVWLFSPPIIAFFVWQVILGLFQLVWITYLLWHNLPAGNGAPRFQKRIIVEIWRFALGMSGTSFFTFFLGQADKIILSKLLSLENFGYYSLAVTLNDQLQLVNAQIVQPLFPRFSALVSQGDRKSLKDLYHKACQLVSVIILPIAGTAAFFSHELIYLWTQNMQIAAVVAPIATLLFAGTIFFNFIEIPVSMAIAHGWVRLAFYRVLVLSLFAIPLIIILSLRLNGIGAALAWASINLLQLFVFPFVFHRRILTHELHRWYIFDVGIPVLISLAVLILARWLMPTNLSFLLSAITIGLIALLLFGLLVLSVKEVRAWAIELGRKYFPKYLEA